MAGLCRDLTHRSAWAGLAAAAFRCSRSQHHHWEILRSPQSRLETFTLKAYRVLSQNVGSNGREISTITQNPMSIKTEKRMRTQKAPSGCSRSKAGRELPQSDLAAGHQILFPVTPQANEQQPGNVWANSLAVWSVCLLSSTRRCQPRASSKCSKALPTETLNEGTGSAATGLEHQRWVCKAQDDSRSYKDLSGKHPKVLHICNDFYFSNAGLVFFHKPLTKSTGTGELLSLSRASHGSHHPTSSPTSEAGTHAGSITSKALHS